MTSKDKSKPEINIDQKVDHVAEGGTVIGVQMGLTTQEVESLFLKLKNESQPTVWDGRTPYLGLTAFQESDEQFFFGREALVGDLLERVNASNFVTISGPSGSGKSSVARAGLFHALRSGRLNKSDKWLLAIMQPEGKPFEQLAKAVEQATKDMTAGDAILKEPKTFQRQVEMQLSTDKSQRFVLLVDQFEELFTQTKNIQERVDFINLLTEAVTAEDSRIIIILSLRSDFISHCTVYPGLRRLMSQQLQLVGAMEANDLAKAITLPALEVGAEIDPALVSRIINDMKGEPGALPLMSFALRDLFEKEKSAVGQPMDMTLPEYLEAGGLERSLERHAQEVFQSFTPEQEALTKSIFSKLIEIGQGRVDTRRIANLAELTPAGESYEQTLEVVNALAQEGVRLITTSGSTDVEQASTATVTIAHEKLIEAWPWLRQLVDENREIIALQNQINRDAQEWEKEEDEGFLYRGSRLAQIEDRLTELTPSLSALASRFVQTAIQHREEEKRKQIEQRQRELEQQRALAEEQQKRAEEAEQAQAQAEENALRVRNRNRIAFILAGLAIMAAIFAVFMLGRANESTQQAQNNAATAEAEKGRADINANFAATQEVFANEKAEEAEAEAQAALEAGTLAEIRANFTKSQALAAEAEKPSTDGEQTNLLLAIESNLIIDQRDFTSSEAFDVIHSVPEQFPIVEYSFAHNHPITHMVWNQDRTQILTSSEDGTANVWDASNGELILSLVNEGAEVITAKWNRDESQILTSTQTNEGGMALGAVQDGVAQVWDAKTGELMLSLVHGRGDAVVEAIWNRDESQILTKTIDEEQFVWDAFSGEAVESPSIKELLDFEQNLSQDGKMALIINSEEEAEVWDVESQELIHTLSHDELSNGNRVIGASWSPDGSQIITNGGEDGNVVIWDTQSGNQVHVFEHESENKNIFVSRAIWKKDGTQILTVSRAAESLRFFGAALNGEVQLWDVTSGELVHTLSHGVDSDIKGGIWNDDESLILTSGSDGVKVWDAINGNLVQTAPHDGYLSYFTWNPDGSRIISAGYDGIVKVWETASGDLSYILSHENNIVEANWLQNESRIVTRSGRGDVNVWNVEKTSLSPIFLNGGRGVWNGQGNQILTQNISGSVKILDAQSGNVIQTISPEANLAFAKWSHEDKLILTGSRDGMVKIWNAENGSQIRAFNHGSRLWEALWNEDEGQIITVGFDSSAKVWDAGRDIPPLTLAHEDRVLSAAWNRDNGQILTVSFDGTAKVWDAKSGDNIHTLVHTTVYQSKVFSAAWSPDERLIFTSGENGTIKIWDSVTGEELQTLSSNDLSIADAIWNQDGSQILASSADGTARMWDVENGEVVFTLSHDAGVLSAQWNGDESQVLTISLDETAKIWDASDGRLLHTLPHADWILDAAWNQDESQIRTSSGDGTVKVWNADTGVLLYTLAGDDSLVRSAEWNHDESELMFSTANGNIFRYLLRAQDRRTLVCKRVTRNLTWQEFQKFVGNEPYRKTCSNVPVHCTVPEADWPQEYADERDLCTEENSPALPSFKNNRDASSIIIGYP